MMPSTKLGVCLATFTITCMAANASIFRDQHNNSSISIDGADVKGNGHGRIVGGELVFPRDSYPWFAITLNLDQSGGFSWAECGGMLVAPEYVLTAAHCLPVFEDGNEAVMVGAVCPFRGHNCGEPRQTIKVERIIAHPEFDSDSFQNDFALLKLETRANADPVSMDQGSYVINYSNDKRNIYAAGFGSSQIGGSSSSRLRHVELAFVPASTCSSSYSLTSYMICAADPGQDTCQGDSGGPLYDVDNDVLIGVTSFGNGCADPDFPGVYAKVASRWNWIKATICNEHSDPQPSFCSPCNEGQIDVSISVGTDDFPEENTWVLKSSDGNSESSGVLLGVLTTYNSQFCLDKSLCHTFTIDDSFGDGMSIKGGFSILLDNVEVLSNPGSSAFSSLIEEFGDCDSSNPSASPTTALSSSNCIDTPFRFRLTKDGENISRNCIWVSNRDTRNRCSLDGVPSMCPNTCKICGACFDGQNRFTLPWNGRSMTRGCAWVGKKQKVRRCAVPGVANTCRVTCNSC